MCTYQTIHVSDIYSSSNFLVSKSLNFRSNEVNVNVSIDLSSLGNLFYKQITRLENECFK